VTAVRANKGWGCGDCRKQFAKADRPVPCEEPDGILPDGTCQYGYPELTPADAAALEVWSDIRSLGAEAAMALNRLELTDLERGDLLVRLRVLAAEVNRADSQEAEKATSSLQAGRGR
jgi:hypothetical protein